MGVEGHMEGPSSSSSSDLLPELILGLRLVPTLVGSCAALLISSSNFALRFLYAATLKGTFHHSKMTYFRETSMAVFNSSACWLFMAHSRLLCEDEIVGDMMDLLWHGHGQHKVHSVCSELWQGKKIHVDLQADHSPFPEYVVLFQVLHRSSTWHWVPPSPSLACFWCSLAL